MLTQRLGSETQKDPAFLAELIAAIQAHPGSCDEVWLATDYGFPSMETHRASAEALGKIAEKFRAIGVRVSLQLSNSLGHGQYMSARDCSGLVYEGSPAENMVGHRGERADYCFCWRGAHVREYVRQELSLYAAAVQPDTVWIDDDLRATNHFPVEYGCFCETCLTQFCARYGVEISREALVRAINRGEAVWRARWVEFVREGLRDFTDEMARAIHAVSPDSAIGLQGCAHGAYTGYGYDFLYSAMREATGKPPKSRPGGGAYNDHNPLAFLEKAVLLNWQNEMLPAYVREIRPEIENLPDVPYGKSIPGTILETTLYLACGANAMSYAMLMNDYEPMAWHAQMLAGFARHRPYWQALAAANEGTAQAGLIAVTAREGWKRPLAEGEADFAWSREAYADALPLMHAAIPVAMRRERQAQGAVYLLSAANAAALGAEEIEFLLARSVLCDGGALEALARRGYRFGARAVPVDVSQLYERYLPHPVNGAAAGRTWSQTLFVQKGHRLEDLDGTTEPFSLYGTNSKNRRAETADPAAPYGIANAFVTTQAGAKWAVFGHNLWQSVISSEKRRQILAAAEALQPGALAAILDTPWQAWVLPREDANGRVSSVSVVNLSPGASESLSLRVRRPKGGQLTLMGLDLAQTPVSATPAGPDEIQLRLPPIPAWSVATLFLRG